MTELLTTPVEVRCDGDGDELRAVRFDGGWRSVTRTTARWLVETDWWRVPVRRDYRRCLLADGAECLELWRDLIAGDWWLARRYD